MIGEVEKLANRVEQLEEMTDVNTEKLAGLLSELQDEIKKSQAKIAELTFANKCLRGALDAVGVAGY